MNTPLVKALIVSIVFVALCFLLYSFQRDYEGIRVLLVIITFPGFLLTTLAGMGIHDFDPLLVYPINGVILFAIIYSALVVARSKNQTSSKPPSDST